MNNVLYCIIHTQRQPDRYDNIVNTWAQGTNFIFYSDHEDADKKIIKASDRSDYSSGEDKQVNIVNILVSSTNYSKYDWYFFCDNDTFVNTNKMNALLETCDPDKVHGLVANGWPPDPTMSYCGGGAGFLISNNILHKINNNIFVQNTGYGDIAMGLALNRLGIQLQHHNSFHSFPPNKYNYRENEIKEQTTFHYITDSALMSALYENTKSYT